MTDLARCGMGQKRKRTLEKKERKKNAGLGTHSHFLGHMQIG